MAGFARGGTDAKIIAENPTTGRTQNFIDNAGSGAQIHVLEQFRRDDRLEIALVGIQRNLFEPTFNERHGGERRPHVADLYAIGRKRRRREAALQQQSDQPAQAAPRIKHRAACLSRQINQSFTVASLGPLNCVQTQFFGRQERVFAVAEVEKPAGHNLAEKFQLRVVRSLVALAATAKALDEGSPITGRQRAPGNAFDCGTSRDFFQMGPSKLPDNRFRPVLTDILRMPGIPWEDVPIRTYGQGILRTLTAPRAWKQRIWGSFDLRTLAFRHRGA